MSDGAWGLCYDAGQVVVAAAGSHVVATCRVSREPAAFVVERAKCPKFQTSKRLSPHARRRFSRVSCHFPGDGKRAYRFSPAQIDPNRFRLLFYLQGNATAQHYLYYGTLL